MKRERTIPAAAILWLIIIALCAAAGQRDHTNIKQVMVIAERASVYIEPSRGSTRIDIVAKGDLLNLLQTKKVKGTWYYVSYSSSRYRARVSGFVLDSAVELVGEAVPPAAEIKKPEEKPATSPPLPPVRPEAKKREEPRPEPPPPPRIEESLVETTLADGQRIALLQTPPPQETPWRKPETSVPEIKPDEAKAKAAEPPPARPAPKPEPPEKHKETVPKEAAAPKPPPAKAAPPPEPKEKQAPPPIIKPSRLPGARKGPGGISLAVGYGSSFGGAGASFQFSTNRGIALHAGAGVFPTTLIYSDTEWVKNETLWSIGLKYYLPIRSILLYPYVDIQYGGLRVEAAQAAIGIWDYDYVYSREQKALWGPSVLAGVELRKGRLGICGALGVSYVTTSWDFLQDRVALAFDMSVVVHFR